MYAQVEKTKENRSRSIVHSVAQKKSDVKQGFGFVDNRQKTLIQRRLQKITSDSQPELLSGFQGDAVQKKREVNLAENPLNNLSDKEKEVFAIESYKKGKPIQMMTKQGFNGGTLYGITAKDKNTGTDTTPTTRAHVNNSSTPKPKSVDFDFALNGTRAGAMTAVQSDPNSYSTKNTKAHSAYSNGSYWDAGHKLGKQNGGSGDDVNEVFPQNPAINQGNHQNVTWTTNTFSMWRHYENALYNGVNSKTSGAWWVKLNY